MITLGPTRLILLHAGKYSFAEVELDRAVHLVAPNNVGKTTLIAALQFLYIDNAKSMDFAYSLDKTRKYYFPTPYSYILFECLTPKGYQVLGVHGQGPVQSFQYERYVYTGRFELEDYLDDRRQPRKWEDVRGRLTIRSYAAVRPSDIPGLLTGLGRSKAWKGFGIIPVRQRTGYERFRKLFTNLLKLGRLRQEDLKRILIDTWEPDLRQREIDLAIGFRDRFDDVRRQRESVEALQTIVPTIDRALDAQDRRQQERDVLPGLWSGLHAVAEREIAALNTEIEAQTALAQRALQRQQESQKQVDEHDHLHVEYSKKFALVERELEELDEQAARFHEYLPEFALARLRQQKYEIEELQHRLRSARSESLDDIRQQLREARERHADLERSCNEHEHLVVTHARKRLSDDTLGRAFALLNPKLLEASVGANGVRVTDQRAIEKLLGRMAERERDGRFRSDASTISAQALVDADISALGDIDKMKARLSKLDREVKRLAALEETLSEQKALQDDLQQKNEVYKSERKTQEDYEEFAAKQTDRPELERQRDEHADAADAAASEKRRLEQEARKSEKDAHAARARSEECEKSITALRERMAALVEPHWSHPPPAEASPLSAPLDKLIGDYTQRTRRERDAHEKLQSALLDIERVTYDQYVGDDETATLTRLRAARDALPERQKSLDELWRSLMVSLKNAFKGLADDLDTLASKVDSLNRKLGHTDVSNLERLALCMERDRELARYVRDIQHQEAMPLFGSRQDAERALARIGELLRDRPRIHLRDMFDLHFEVTTPGADPRTYTDLDRIESNGTTVTIKVLVTLHLLNELLSDRPVRIPFFLDEVASLDRRNLRGIVTAAQGMNFCPILASPQASDSADVLYYLTEGSDGRIVLQPDSPARVEIRRSADAEL